MLIGSFPMAQRIGDAARRTTKNSDKSASTL